MIGLDEFLVFKDSKILNEFLDSIRSERGKIEYGLFDQFTDNRILFTAEHAFHFRIPTPELGERSFIGIGDRNTDKIAKLMAFRIKSGFIVFNVPRTEADASRPIHRLGKGEKLFVVVVRNRKVVKKHHIQIHQNKKYLPILKRYHEIIEEIDPRMIVSVHGIHARHKADVVLGLGKKYNMINTEKSASLLKNTIKKRIGGTLAEGLNIRFSKKFLTGEKNYVLQEHVISHNKKSDEKRAGMQIEFNMRGRVVWGKPEFISKDYQVGAQVIADSVLEWLKKR